jgi:hypothetical protein
MIKILQLFLLLSALTLQAEEHYLLPNVEVLEMEIDLNADQQDLFFAWGKEEFKKYKVKNRLLAGKALALCRMLSKKDAFDKYFLSMSYGLKYRSGLVDTGGAYEEFLKFTEGTEDQKRLAWYIFDYLHASDGSEACAKIAKDLPQGNWEFLVSFIVNGFHKSLEVDPAVTLKAIVDHIKPSGVYHREPRSPQRKTATVNGLIVSDLSNHRSVGTTAKITATVLDVNHNERAVFLDEHTGLNMKRSLSNAELALSKRFPVLYKNNNIRVSFERRESYKDGNSAGVAFTLLLYSIYEGIELDQDTAVTGVIMPDLSVKAVGGVPSKVRGAHIKGMKYIVIPEENKEIVADMTLLYELSTIWRTQIFTASKFTDTLKIAKVKKDSKTKEAIERFSAVAEILDKGKTAIRENRDFLMSELDAVLKLKPNHESARVLSQFFKGQRPRRLSLHGSADLLFMIVDRTLRITVSEAYKTSEEAFLYNRAFLVKSSKKLNPSVAKFTSKLSSYITTMIKYRNLLEKNILKDSSSIGTAFSLMDKEGEQLEKTRGELDKIWRQIAKNM